MKSTFSLCATVVLATLSTGLGLAHPTAGAGLTRSFAQNRRRLQEDYGFNGSTPEEVCDSVLENWYFPGFPEQFFTTCTCEPKLGGGYSVSCIDYCEYCLPGACSRFSSTFELNSDLHVEKLEGCDDFTATSFNGVTVCYKEDYTTSPATLGYFVDGQQCTSYEYVSCGTDSLSLPRVDCANLGFGMDMNFCEEGTITGPFGFVQALWYGIDDFSVGTCSPPQCQSALDASDVCIETELSGSQGADCRSCVVQAFQSIDSTNPSSCTEAEEIVCALINQCNNECVSCEDKVKDFVECYFPNVPGGTGCSIDCFTSMPMTSGTMSITFVPLTALGALVVVAAGYFI